MGGFATSPTKPEKGRAGKRKAKYVDRPKGTLTGDHECASSWPWINLTLGL